MGPGLFPFALPLYNGNKSITMERQELINLADKILNNEASDEEVGLYVRWFEAAQSEGRGFIPDAASRKAAIYAAVLQNRLPRRLQLWAQPMRIAAAAMVILALGSGIFFLVRNRAATTNQTAYMPDVKAGGHKAILTLSSGKQLVLNDTEVGDIVVDQGVKIKKSNNGRIEYDLRELAVAGAGDKFNTITTPRGGEYQVILPDGSKVWLNAASSLKFPVAFNGGQRNVELTGEAYFEVAKDKTKPFHVKTANQTIEVLGTHFDIDAYDDEQATTTTLLEGSVKVNNGRASLLLAPGQQSLSFANKSAALRLNINADVEEAVAWKEGLFTFNQTDIPTFMRQISRWYNVDIVYENKIPTDSFSGTLSRSVNLSKVLTLLKFTGMNYKIEGRKLIIK